MRITFDEYCAFIAGAAQRSGRYYVLWSPVYSGIKSRDKPEIKASYGGDWPCLKFVELAAHSGDFFQLAGEEGFGWFRGLYVEYGARIAPQDQKRMHIKVRDRPVRTGSWLLHKGKNVEVEREQTVALLEWNAAERMVLVGFSHNEAILTGWVKDENLHWN